MAANQVQIPVIQIQDASLTQVQQNVNKVLRNINNQVVMQQSLLDQTNIVGEIKIANLTLAEFQSVASADWVLCDGASCVGTKYSLLTGNNVVPTLSLGSVNNFIKVN